jgi:hypothetical protein
MPKKITLIHWDFISNEFLKWKRIIEWKPKNIFNKHWSLPKLKIMKFLDVMGCVNIDMVIEKSDLISSKMLFISMAMMLKLSIIL